MSGEDLTVVTKSRLATYCRCQRLEFIQYQQGYRSLAPRPEADWGTVIHAGLDGWYEAHRRGETLVALTDALAAMQAARTTATGVDDFAMAKAEVMMVAYDARWTSEMADWEVLGSEVEFVAVIKGRKLLRVAGKLDRLLRRRSTGRIWFGENKTTGADLSAGSTYHQRLRMDPQVSIYYRGVASLGHDDVEGCLYDIIVRPDFRPKKATPVDLRKYTQPTKKDPVSRLYANQRENDEVVDEYRARIGAAISAAPEAFFARTEIVRLETELAESERDVEELALQIRRGAITGTSARNPDSCYLYGRTCEFVDACAGVASLDDATRFVKLERPHSELSEEIVG